MLNNQKILYDLFFKSVSETFIELSVDKKFLFPVKVMGALFRGKFLFFLKQESFYGTIKTDLTEKKFNQFLDSLYKKNRIAYSKPPFKKPETVFEYLGRYTHRIAISNYRIVAINNDQVYFK